jgi:4'-phosphopantetheinyl transferase
VTAAGVDRLGPDELQVWTLRFADAATMDGELGRALDETERARAERFAAAELSQRWTIARGTLRAILASYLGVPARDVPLVARPCTACGGPHGKPALAGPAGDLCFNVSHTRDRLVVAVVRGREVGVDAEPVNGGRPLGSTASSWLAPSEARVIESLAPAARQLTLVRLWTVKEAYVKAVGTGLNTDLRAVVVGLGEQAVLLAAPGEPSPDRWLLLPVEVADDTAVSLAVARKEHESWTPDTVVRSFEDPSRGS